MFVSAIVPAAGLGLRLGSTVSKPLVRLDKKPIYLHTLKILNQHPDIKEIILAVSERNSDAIKKSLGRASLKKVKAVVLGGSRRRDSVENALARVSVNADLVLIHDAVRPFIALDLVSRVIRSAAKSGAAVLGVPVKSTIKEIDKKDAVIRTLNRDCLYEIQTPQVFRRELIMNAFKKFRNVACFDDASLVERLGNRVEVVMGSYLNIKITTREDLLFARAIISR